MKKFKLIALSTAAVLLLGTAGIAYAQPGHHGGMYGREWKAQAVELSQEQMAQLDAARARHRAEVEPLHQQMIIKRAELKSEMISQNPDSGKVEALHKEIGELQGKLANAQIKHNEELAAQGLPSYYRGGHYAGGYFGHKGPGYMNDHRGGYGHRGYAADYHY